MTKVKDEERYCTYKVYDPDIQKIIYVGMTSNLHRRIREHGHDAKWWKPTLRFDAINEGMRREEASADEKYWIQHYSENGHPLQNSSNNPRLHTEWHILASRFGADPDSPNPEIEKAVQCFFKGRELLKKRDNEDMEWRLSYSWDRIYFAMRAAIKELAIKHNLDLSELDIVRMVANALELNIDIEVEL